MMKKKVVHRAMTVAVLGGGLLLGATAGASEEAEAAIYDWPASDAPVLIENQSGLFLLGKDGKPLRVFSWNQNRGAEDRAVRLTDMDGDGSPNIVGSGTPSFILQANGNPIFGEADGCRQVLVGRMVGRRGQDLACVKRREIRAYTGDGQFAWSVSPARNLDRCRIGDVTGDGRPDLECKYQGRESYLRVSADGAILVEAGESPLLEGGEGIDLARPVEAGVWTGEERYDLNGDGAAAETLHVTETGLEVRRSGEEETLFTIETEGVPRAALVKDLDGDGKPSIVAVTDARIYVASAGGEEVASHSANAGRYRRLPFGDLVSVHARGFGEADGAAREAVSAVQDRISQCYGNRLRAHPFAGSGRQMLQVTVDGEGKVESVTQMASQVGDQQVENCTRQALERGSYPPAAEGSATINVNVVFTFRDEER